MDAINELRNQLREYIERHEPDPAMRTLMLQLLEADAVFLSILFELAFCAPPRSPSIHPMTLCQGSAMQMEPFCFVTYV